MVDGMTRQGVSGAGGELDYFLRAAAAGFGPEIDSLQSAYSQDTSRFEVFRASPAFVALKSVYRTLATQAISRATGGPSPLAAAVHQAKAVHEAEWRRLYEGSRAGRSSAQIPGNAEPMTAESVPPEIQGLPNEPGVILETHDAAVDVVRISNGDMSRLALPAELSVYPAGVPAQGCALPAASWAPKARKLLIGWRGHVALIDREGAVRDLHLTMPGALKPLTGMCDFIVSPDASLVAYTINTSWNRVEGEGPYVGVMYQSAAGSVPKSISGALSVPDWSPDNLKLAYRDSNGELAAADIAGKKLWSIHLADGGVKSDYGPSDLELQIPQLRSTVSEIRWAPDGHSLGVLIGLPARLYRFRSDGTPQGEVHFAQRDMTVDRFAWSPSGKQIVFRSGYGGFQCTGTLSFKDKDIHGLAPCRAGSDLFISNSDGSDVKRLSKQTNSTMGASQLFWIQ
jgi:hypothetical protein